MDDGKTPTKSTIATFKLTCTECAVCGVQVHPKKGGLCFLQKIVSRPIYVTYFVSRYEKKIMNVLGFAICVSTT